MEADRRNVGQSKNWWLTQKSVKRDNTEQKLVYQLLLEPESLIAPIASLSY